MQKYKTENRSKSPSGQDHGGIDTDTVLVLFTGQRAAVDVSLV
ncbi:unnamed protein product [Commensalibacter communis]|nr:unnamed protein product [Commensalibacter communis]CAI3959127.1 unnamed protein product [Commensalibacter communis]